MADQKTNREILKDEVRSDEGYEDTTYLGPVTGLPHIGYGHLLGEEQTDEELQILGLDDEPEDWTGFKISREQAEQLLDRDVDDAMESLAPTWDVAELEALDTERFIALMSMAYQMGGYKIQKKFPSFVKAMKEKDYDRAADEMLWSNGLRKERRSAWYKQTPERCQEMADRMRHGTATVKAANDVDSFEDIPIDELSTVPIEDIFAEIKRRIDAKGE